MSETRASVIVDLAGNLPRQAQRYGQSFKRLGGVGKRSLRLLRSSAVAAGRSLDRLGNRYTAILSGGAAALAAKNVIDFDAALTRTGTNVNISSERIDALKNSLFKVANLPNVRLPVDQLFESVNRFLNKTGDIDFVEKNMGIWGVALQGLGSNADATGLLMAQFWEKGIRNPDTILKTLDRMFAQFSKGSVQVGEIAAIAPQLFSIVTSQGPAAVTQLSALEQIYAKTAGSAERSVTSLRATFNVFNDSKSANLIDRILTDRGFAKAKKANGEFRDLHTLLLDIVSAAGNNEQTLFKIFGREEALFGLKALLNPENKVLLNEMVEGQITYGLTLNAAAKNAATAKSAFNALQNTLRVIADAELSGPIQDLATWTNNLKPERVKDFFDKAITGAKVLGGIFIANKLLQFGGGFARAIGGTVRGARGARTGGMGSALGAAGAAPVFVVNMPGGGLGSGAGSGGKVGGKGKRGLFSGPTKGQQISARGRGLLNRLRFATQKLLPKLGVAASTLATSSVAAVAAAGAAGFGVGTVGFKLIDETQFTDNIGGVITKSLAFFGNEQAQRTLAEREQFKQSLSALTKSVVPAVSPTIKPEPINAELTVKIESEGRARITELKATPGVDLATEQRLGPSMETLG